MSKSLKSTSGFTLIEVLLSTVIMATMLLLMGMAFRSSAEGNSTLVNKAELVEDVRSAGQMISDYARNAIYVYPPGTPLTLRTGAATVGYGVVNPRTLTNVWTVGTDNIVAFILPPLRGLNPVYQLGVNVVCNPLNASPVPFDTNPSVWLVDDSACLTFVAYYTLSRSSVVTATTGNTDNPGDDPLNNSKGMIYEYRLQLPLDRLAGPAPVPGSATGSPPIVIGSVTGFGPNFNSNPALLADYIDEGATAGSFKFKLSSLTCLSNLANSGRYLNNTGGVLPVTTTVSGGVTSTAYNTSTALFTPGCPNSLVAATQLVSGSGNLDAFASIVQATLTISAGRKNNLGQTFTTGDMTFPIAPVNLLIPGT